ncbi:hypothetical protein CspHIS471_0312170 [Cutaneotrichosporon sp. HIS471]|nr:hypothetical protein CspHIS471_0312170 [Cutaneotrichosporon sp. HIS471]
MTAGTFLTGIARAVDRIRPAASNDDSQPTTFPDPNSPSQSQLDLPRHVGLDTSNIPADFLNSYPYPAFVLISGSPDAKRFPPLPWARSKFANLHPFEPVWSNRRWKRLSRGRPLLDGLSVDSSRKLADWLGSSRPETAEALDESGVSGNGVGARRSTCAGRNPSLTLTFAFGPERIVFQLSKTYLPINQPDGAPRIRAPAQAFAVVTATPVEQDVTAAIEARSRQSCASSSTAEVHKETPPMSHSPCQSLGEAESRDLPMWDDAQIDNEETDEFGPLAPGRPLYLFSDGSFVNSSLPGPTEESKVSDVVALLESTDWSATQLGPRETWSASLQASVRTVMEFPFAAGVWWGKELTMIYNQLYADSMPDHPKAFGRSGSSSWAELWRFLGPLSDIVRNGTPVVKEDALFLETSRKSPRLREVFRTQLWVPLRDDMGQYVGVYLTLHDTTLKVLAERRAIIHRALAQRACTKSLEDYNQALLDTLEEYPRDAPFALIFHVESTTPNFQPRKMGSRASSFRGAASSVRLRYTGGVGVPEGHPSAPPTCSVELLPGEQPTKEMMASAFTALEVTPGQPACRPNLSSMRRVIFNTDAEGQSASDEDQPAPAEQWPLAEALRARQPIIVRDCSKLIEGYPVRVWDELPTSAIVIPISYCDGDLPGALLVLGLSCRLPFDAEYQAFLLSALFTAARFHEEETKRAEELADLERAKKLLLANVSHDLVTPLSLIAGPLDDVLAEMPAGRQRESLNMARRNVQRLSRLVDMLMDLSSLETGNMAGSFRRVNLGEVTRNVAAMFKQASDAAHLTYIVECDMENRDVYIDRDKYEKILFTLIGNALRFTCDGTVHVTVHYKDDKAVVSVEDTGVGIPAKDLAFGDKYPIDDAFTHEHEGWGICLLFTKKLVQLHHGLFNIESCTAGESSDGSHGTRFTVTLPLGCQHLPPDSVEKSDVSDGTPLQQFHQSVIDTMSRAHWGWTSIPKEDVSHNSTSSTPSSADPRARGIDPNTVYFESTDIVLLVDSLHDTRQYMRDIFSPFCKVVEACDGNQALEMVNKHHPNLIIADVMLPKMNGFELVTELKRGTPEQQMVPIILLTSMQDARADGAFAADDYMPKPFNARELIARAHMQLQLGKKRRALESAFDLRTQELRLLTEYSPVGIFRCSEDGYVHYANQTWHEISGYPQSSQPITNWGDYVQADHQERVSHIWQQYVSKQAIHERTEWPWRNGRWVDTTVIRVNRDGTPASIIGCTVDITERKLNERMHREQVLEAEERRAAAEEARRQQELLIDITSHEIRNPISSLMQCASLVKSNLLALQEYMRRAVEEDREIRPTDQLLVTMGEDIEALDSIYQCGLTQERISNDVLSLGKIQLGMLQMFDTQTNIRKEAQKLIFVFQNEARMKRLNLSLNIGPGFQRLGVERILTDPVRLGQVVTNLLSNAIRFTSNSPVRRVELRLDLSVDPPPKGCAMPQPSKEVEVDEDTPLYLYVSVADTGPGLTSAELQVLFQRFSQASPQTHTVYGGSGLGLFVCRQLTERMGGHIDVVSEHGHGSEFRFYIRTRACLSPETPPAESPRSDNAANDVAGPFKPHILVVEDNIINRTVLVRQLQHVGLTVESASNGLEALERLRVSQRPRERANGSTSATPSHSASGSANPSRTHTPTGVATSPGGKEMRRNVSSISKDAKAIGRPKRFDCVLMDLEMPVMDGYTSVRLLRADESKGLLVPTNVVALTGNARQAQVPEAMADFTDVVVKPYRLDDLLRTIDDSMRKYTSDLPRCSSESVRSGLGTDPVAPVPQAHTEPSNI